MNKLKLGIQNAEILLEKRRIKKRKQENQREIILCGVPINFCASQKGWWTYFKRFDIPKENKNHKERFYLKSNPEHKKREHLKMLENIRDAYIGNIAQILALNFDIHDTFFTDRDDSYGPPFTDIESRDPKDIKFTWYVGYTIEREMTINHGDKKFYETWREVGMTKTIKKITPSNEKNRMELYKFMTEHPHFEFLDKLWEEKTGHKLNWFKYPTSSLTGEFVFDNDKWKPQKASVHRGWLSSWADKENNKEIIMRKFAA